MISHVNPKHYATSPFLGRILAILFAFVLLQVHLNLYLACMSLIFFLVLFTEIIDIFPFSLSYRDVSELLRESGISVHPTTIMRWVHEYGNFIHWIWKKKKNKSTYFARHLDETYIKVKGERCYLYHAID